MHVFENLNIAQLNLGKSEDKVRTNNLIDRQRVPKKEIKFKQSDA